MLPIAYSFLDGLASIPIITAIGVLVGMAVAVGTLYAIIKKREIKAPAVGMLGIAAFLLVGSQWTTFKVSEGGLEVSRAAGAADEIAAQVEQLAAAVDAIREQVRVLAEGTPSVDTRGITAALKRAPRPDLDKLAEARRVLGRVARTTQ